LQLEFYLECTVNICMESCVRACVRACARARAHVIHNLKLFVIRINVMNRYIWLYLY